MKGDAYWMERALALAARGLGETNPNPVVGCVIVKGGRAVGQGFHRRAGGPHAEAIAIRQAGARARGATLYVTLEPCAHTGRTPPCAPAVAASGVARVVVAVLDPNPRVNGRGVRLLRSHGLALTVGVGRERAALLNQRFLVAAARERPFVLLKAGLTLDGRIATVAGRSKWITGARPRAAARRLRRLFDGVAVGIGTVLADDPLLLPDPRVRRPFTRVVFDRSLRLPLRSRLVRTVDDGPVLVITSPEADPRRRAALDRAGVAVVPVRSAAPAVALRLLWKRRITSLMVEGGSELLGAFLAARTFDQVVLFRSPVLLGGRGSLGAFGGPDPRTLEAAVALQAATARVPRAVLEADPALAPVIRAGGEVWYPAALERKG